MINNINTNNLELIKNVLKNGICVLIDIDTWDIIDSQVNLVYNDDFEEFVLSYISDTNEIKYIFIEDYKITWDIKE